MATDEDFQKAQEGGGIYNFVPRTRDGTDVRGRVMGRGDTTVVTSSGAAQTWKIQDEHGGVHQIAAANYDMT